LGIEISAVSGFPLLIFTQAEHRPRSHYEQVIEERGLLDELKERNAEWLFFEKGDLRVNLYEVPHDTLAVVGAYGHGGLKEVLFGSKMEEIQTVLPNSMLIVGPNCSPT